MNSNRKRSYGAYASKAGTASLYSGKKRYVARLPKSIRSLGPISRQAIRTGGWANPARGGELKFLDVSNNTGPTVDVATFGAGVLLNGCANGSDASSRIGRKIVLKSVLVRYQFAMAPTSTFSSPFRIMVVYDKQANAAAPAITDILLTDHFSSQNNLSNRDRFVTIFDHVTQGCGNQSEFSISGVLYKKLNLETMFNGGSAGTVGDITSGSLYMFVAQTGRIGTASPTQATRIRVRFDDV